MYRAFFVLSQGLATELNVREGHYQDILKRIAIVEAALGLVAEQYKDNPPHWKHTKFENVSDAVLCNEALAHNAWVRRVYNYWASEPTGPEILTPEMAQGFWHALSFIRVPVARWTTDYYQHQMERLFDVMVKGERDGITFDNGVLTPQQAAQIILLFSEFIDCRQVDLIVPAGYDFLTTTDGCEWCYIHGEHRLHESGCDEIETCQESECGFVLDREETQ